MRDLEILRNPAVDKVFEDYPDFVKDQMQFLRNLVLETAAEIPGISKLEETLKWGEPSYLTKSGSTLRMDWKQKKPDQYAMYFKCTSKLVESFRQVFGDRFEYEKNRAIVFQLNQEVPVSDLKHCIRATLRYHEIKNEELLGLSDLLNN